MPAEASRWRTVDVGKEAKNFQIENDGKQWRWAKRPKSFR
jgi:hypothetical protein